jgi:arsenate reductase (thioredoxin)
MAKALHAPKSEPPIEHQPIREMAVNLIEAGSSGTSPERSGLTDEKPQAKKPVSHNVLFLCADNSIRSIMAEALLRRWGGKHFGAFSAGALPKSEVDPLAVDLLKSHRIWREDLKCKGCPEFLAEDAPRMEFVISVGERAPAGLPAAWPGNPRLIHWRITEPIIDGDPVEKERSFRRAFVELETRIKLFVLVHQKKTARWLANAA